MKNASRAMLTMLKECSRQKLRCFGFVNCSIAHVHAAPLACQSSDPPGSCHLLSDFNRITRQQGNVLTTEKLLRVNLDSLSIANDQNLAGVNCAIITSADYGLGDGQTLGPRNDRVADQADDGNVEGIALLNSGQGLLLACDKGRS